MKEGKKNEQEGHPQDPPIMEALMKGIEK